MEQKIEYRDRSDHKIMFILVSLIAFGLVMIYSVASSQNNLGLFYKQTACLGTCFIALCLFHRISMDFLSKIAPLMYVLSYVFIGLLKAPEPITVTVNGATRWLNFVVFRFQVAEFVKLAVIITLACWIRYADSRRGPWEEAKFIVLTWLIGIVPTVLLMVISNDLSSSMVIAGITFIMSFVACRGKTGWIFHLVAIAGLIGLVVFAIYYVEHNMPTEEQLLSGEVSFRIGRVAAWLHPENYAGSTGFQPLHCLYAIANGGWFGKGLGQSWQKAILPESENDVIFAIIIEELGIFGGLAVLFMFFVLITLICKTALQTKELFGKMICVGVAAHITLQVMIHCGVCTNLIPNTGIGLPFISSGMTAALLQMIEMTIVLSVTRVHVRNLYDPAKELAREKKRKKQRFFTGKKYREKIARERALSRAAMLAKQAAANQEAARKREMEHEKKYRSFRTTSHMLGNTGTRSAAGRTAVTRNSTRRTAGARNSTGRTAVTRNSTGRTAVTRNSTGRTAGVRSTTVRNTGARNAYTRSRGTSGTRTTGRRNMSSGSVTGRSTHPRHYQ